MKRRDFLIMAALAATAAGTGALVLSAEPNSTAAQTETTAPPTRPTAQVTRRDLSEITSFDASVDYGEQWKLVTTASGTVTWRPEVGTVVEPGGQLIRIGDRPVFLARGDMPMYRTISRVPGGPKAQLVGQDVQQLQEFLRAAGFDEKGELRTDGVFDQVTERAIKAWQFTNGLPVTGKVDNSQLVFSPTAVRIATAPRVGQAFEALNVTAANASLTIDVDDDDRELVAPGTEVEVELADGTKLKGRIDELTRADDEGNEGGGNDSPKWRASVAVDMPAGAGDGVTVNVTKVYATQALTVPVGALLAPADGGFAVEVVDGASTRLVRVEIGTTAVDGMIDITGDIAEGDEVVIPS